MEKYLDTKKPQATSKGLRCKSRSKYARCIYEQNQKHKGKNCQNQ